MSRTKQGERQSVTHTLIAACKPPTILQGIAYVIDVWESRSSTRRCHGGLGCIASVKIEGTERLPDSVCMRFIIP